MNQTTTMQEPFKSTCNKLRDDILHLGNAVNQLHQHPLFLAEQCTPGEHAEMHANVTLAYRHLEDARMRIGKVIQAHEGGVSCYDHQKSPSPLPDEQAR